MKFNAEEQRRAARGDLISIVGAPLVVVGIVFVVLSVTAFRLIALQAVGAALFVVGAGMFAGGWQYAEGAVTRMVDRYAAR